MAEVLLGAVGGAFALGVLVGRQFFAPRFADAASAYGDDDDDDDDDGDGGGGGDELAYKMVLCVRTDLKMTKGKACAQCGHAVIGAYKEARRRCPEALRRWERNAQPKITLQITSMAQARALEREARAKQLPTYKVYDAGRTQIAAGSMTVLTIGPAASASVDSVTRHLKLF